MRKKQSAVRRISPDGELDLQEVSPLPPVATDTTSGRSSVCLIEDDSASDIPAGSSDILGLSSNGRAALPEICSDPSGHLSLSDGTVVVQPEAAAMPDSNEELAMMSTNSSSYTPGIYDTIKCTCCGRKVNPYNRTMQLHPLLRVLTCDKCHKFYVSGHFDMDEDGKENQCRWCGEGGSLICCDKCPHSFCKTCIKRNLGRSAVQKIEALDDYEEWACYACEGSPLEALREEAIVVMKAVQEHFKEASRRSDSRKAKAKVKNASGGQGHQSATSSLVKSTDPKLVGLGKNLSLDFSSVPPARPVTKPPAIVPRPPQISRTDKVNVLANSNVNRVKVNSVNAPSRQGMPQLQAAPQARHITQNGMLQQQVQRQNPMMTEQWYKRNIKIENILTDIESVNVNNVRTALNATLTLLQGMTRQYSKFLQELSNATNPHDKNQVVNRFKSSYRMHLFLRLGKLRSLISEEEKNNLRKSSSGGAVASSNKPSSSHRQPLPHSSNHRPSTSTRPNIGVIDLTGSDSSSAAKTAKMAEKAFEVLPQLNEDIRKLVEANKLLQKNTSSSAAVSPPYSQESLNDSSVVVVLDDDDDVDGQNSASAAETLTNKEKPPAILELLAKRKERQQTKQSLPLRLDKTAVSEGAQVNISLSSKPKFSDTEDSSKENIPHSGFTVECEAEPEQQVDVDVHPIEPTEQDSDIHLEFDESESSIVPSSQDEEENVEPSADQQGSSSVSADHLSLPISSSPLTVTLWGKRSISGSIDSDEEPVEKRSRTDSQTVDTPPSLAV